jgi:ribose transport system substrate-binding protein
LHHHCGDQIGLAERHEKKVKMRVKLAVCLVAAAACALSACSSGGGSSSGGSTGAAGGGSAGAHTVDVGTGTPIKLNGSKLNIAYLSYGNTDTYLQAEIAGAKSAASAAGAGLTVFSANFDQATQLNQIQTVLSSGQYNAVVVQPLNGQAVCTPLTKLAPGKGIAVVNITEPMCGDELKPLAQEAVPGLAGIYLTQGTESFEAWIDHSLTINPTVKKIALITGPALNPATNQMVQAAKEALQKHPGVTIVATYATDNSTPSGLAETQTMLQAHPDVQLVLSQASGATVGAAKALIAAGKSGKVILSDSSGASVVLPYIKSGAVQLTEVSLPKTETTVAVQSLVAAFDGKPLPQGRSAIVSLKGGQPVYIDKADVSTFQPQY